MMAFETYHWREDGCLDGASTVGKNEYYGLRIEDWLLTVEVYFTVVFLVEACLKIFAWGSKYYFSGGWDLTDFAICVSTTLALAGRLVKFLPAAQEASRVLSVCASVRVRV